MYKRQHSSKLSGFGLLEILIVLGIIATTMVAASQLALIGFRAIKLNELTDYANGLMLRALEVTKSPNEISLSVTPRPTVIDGSYRFLQTDPFIGYVGSTVTPITIQNCSAASPYYVRVNAVPGVTDPLVCIQLIITRKTNLGDTYYEVRSRLVYNFNGQVVEREIIGYRRAVISFI